MARSASAAPAWLDADPASLAPTVLIVGGFLTSAGWYGGLADALRARGAADVVVAGIWTPDWILAAFRGVGPLVTRAGRALLRASDASAASARSRGAPVLLVGHSAGGTLGRLLTSPVPFEGRGLNASGRIGAVVTLGTPHLLGPDARWGSRMGRAGARFAELHVPGAFFAPTTGYLAVASSAVVGRRDAAADGRSRFARDLYEGVLAQPERDVVEGDGIVPVESALLPGARHLVLPDAIHGPGTRSPWYGSASRIDGWWPAALETWLAALAARRERSAARRTA